jgi:hypothetical protein
MHYLYYTLILLAIILAILGGTSDIRDKRINILGYTPSKEHLWHDSIFLLVLAITLKITLNI